MFADPRHPYTRLLLSAILRPDPHRRLARQAAQGDLPSPANIPAGCRFHTRCTFVIDRCRTEDPSLARPPAPPTLPALHLSACHRSAELPRLDVEQGQAVPPAAARRLALYAERRAAQAEAAP